MEVHSRQKYLCSLQGDLVNQLEDISIFEAALDLAKDIPDNECQISPYLGLMDSWRCRASSRGTWSISWKI
jgi:hypothetical protein